MTPKDKHLSDKQLAHEAERALFRAALTKLTPRQRDGLRLHLLRQGAKEGDSHAAIEAERLAAQLKQNDRGPTDHGAACPSEVDLTNTNETDNHDERR